MGSIWDKPRDFMMELLKKERALTSAWLARHGSTLKDNFKGVMIQAAALSSDKGEISIIYDFENFDECQKELKALEDDAL